MEQFEFPISPAEKIRLMNSGFKSGFLFADRNGRVILQAHSSRLIYWQQLILRNPIREILSVFNPRFRSNLFGRLLKFSTDMDFEFCLAAAAIDCNERTSIMRLREVGRDLSTEASTVAMESIVKESLVDLSMVLNIKRIDAETFDRYGRKLESYGWRVNWTDRNLFMRLACCINRYKPYSLAIAQARQA